MCRWIVGILEDVGRAGSDLDGTFTQLLILYPHIVVLSCVCGCVIVCVHERERERGEERVCVCVRGS